jgi:hypothetical protein
LVSDIAVAQPANYTLQAYQGQTWDDSIVVNQSDGTPTNLTGYSARMQIREEYSSSTTILELNAANGRLTIPTPANGTIVFNVTAADMAAISLNYEPKAYVYDLEIYTGAGYVQRILQGVVLIWPEVTR